MKRLKVTVTVYVKGDQDETDLLEASIREELLAIAEEEESFDYSVADEEDEEEETDF